MGNVPEASNEGEIRVLICDDHKVMRDLLRAMIDDAPGMRTVATVADGNAAIVEAKRLQPDVILLDLAMPILTGLDALPELSRVAPDAKVIVFSGFAAANLADKALALGAARYLEKGTGRDEIIDTIEQVTKRPADLIL
jgi:YesN/AraC family two-component response regulator